MTPGPAQYAVLSALLFAIGLFGVVCRRNSIAAIASLSIVFSAPVVAAVGVAQSGNGTYPPLGTAVGLVVITALCAQLLVGGAIAALVWRRSGTADLDELADTEA